MQVYSPKAYRLDYEFDEYNTCFINVINIKLIEFCANEEHSLYIYVYFEMCIDCNSRCCMCDDSWMI